MTRARTCGTRRRAAGGNVASHPRRVDGTRDARSRRSTSDNTNPAGGINSSAEDMAKWMLVLLDGGVLADGSRLFSERTLRQLTSIVTPLSPSPNPPPELAPLRNNFPATRSGLNVRDYRGKKIVHPHRRPAGLRVAGDDAARARSSASRC